ncbi:MAG: SGNH/GDSL hydrolase family protein [Proteobacteria bacterium]|nr:SGNH/GDSL hydrolase family protein [Pseudomonadota bacterium]
MRALYHDAGSFDRAFGPAFITGASVSDDWNEVKSPGRRVLEMMGARFTKDAFPWSSSEEILEEINEKPPAARTKILIAIDLFFWDPDLGEDANCKPGYVDSVIHELRKHSDRLILAKIPVSLARGDAACVSLINEELEESCVPGNHCYLAPEPDFGGGANPAKYFQPDHLHLSDEGSALAAESVCSTFLRMPSK